MNYRRHAYNMGVFLMWVWSSMYQILHSLIVRQCTHLCLSQIQIPHVLTSMHSWGWWRLTWDYDCLPSTQAAMGNAQVVACRQTMYSVSITSLTLLFFIIGDKKQSMFFVTLAGNHSSENFDMLNMTPA